MNDPKVQEDLIDGNVCSKFQSQESNEKLVKTGNEKQKSLENQNLDNEPNESMVKNKKAPPKPPPCLKPPVEKEDSLTPQDENHNEEVTKEVLDDKTDLKDETLDISNEKEIDLTSE